MKLLISTLFITSICVMTNVKAQQLIPVNLPEQPTNSQSDTSSTPITERENLDLINKEKPVVTDEGTNDPIVSGMTRQFINGQEVYVKTTSTNGVMLQIIYIPKKEE